MPITPAPHYLTGPNGATFRRCQATTKRTGEPCRNPAVRGSNVCRLHGGGNRKQATTGHRKPPGRPVEHGLYSQKHQRRIDELLTEIEANEHDLENTDHELRLLKATLAYLLEQAHTYEALRAQLAAGLEQAAELASNLTSLVDAKDETALRELGMTPSEVRAFVREAAQAERLMARLDGWTTRVSESAVRVIRMVKVRAETRVLLDHDRALELVVRLATVIRNIVWDIVPDDELLDVFEDRLRREFFGPNGIVAPGERVGLERPDS